MADFYQFRKLDTVFLSMMNAPWLYNHLLAQITVYTVAASISDGRWKFLLSIAWSFPIRFASLSSVIILVRMQAVGDDSRRTGSSAFPDAWLLLFMSRSALTWSLETKQNGEGGRDNLHITYLIKLAFLWKTGMVAFSSRDSVDSAVLSSPHSGSVAREPC